MILILYHKCNNPLIQVLQDYILDCATHTLAEVWMAAMLTQSEYLTNILDMMIKPKFSKIIDM